MNEIKSIFSVLILILTIFTVIFQSIGIEVNGTKLGKIDIKDDIKITEDSQVAQLEIESKRNPGSERIKQDKSKVGQKELLRKFSPLEDIRINDYASHILTEEDVTDLKSKVGVRESNKNYNLLFNGLGTGLAPPTQAEWDAMVGNVEVVESTLGSSFPSSLDHSTSTYFPPVRSQASQGSCAAWATTYYAATYIQSKDNGWTQTSSGNNNQILSPAWTYNKANFGYDSGSYTWTNFYVLADLGGATWSTMPYNQFKDLYWGSETAWREAQLYRFGKMKWTNPQEIDVLKSWLNDGFVLPFALDAGEYSNLGSGDNTISSSEYDSSIANHANTIVGYDDDKKVDGDIGAFKIVNSWGSSWGSSWGGNGYYWMTYKAFAELTNPVIMFYDKIDYDPTLLATWNITGSCSRKADITLGVGDPSLPNGSTTPYWLGGTHDLPKFMCLDITEFRDSVGLSSFFLEVDSGAVNGSISSFKLELYENGYVVNGSSLKSPESPEVIKTNPCTVNNSISGFQIIINTPEEGQWCKGIIQSIGVAQDPVEKTVLNEDFENDFPGDWVVGDSDSAHGLDTWGSTTTRSYKGFRSGWCAAVAEPIFEEDFDSNDTLPDGWLNYSEGPDYQKWNVTNTGYQFTYDGDDYGLVCDNNLSGTGGNITEWLYMNSTSSFNTSEYSDIVLEFFLDYEFNDGDEFAQILYATDSAYPTFTILKTWTASTYGLQKLNFSAAAGKDKVYLAFRYHGTNDSYMFIDDLRVIYNSTNDEYDNNMESYIYRSVNLSGFDKVNLSYEFWLDSESGFDSLYVLYYQESSWHFIDEHNGSSGGWKKSYTLIPTNATQIGFHFNSDSSASYYEGAYVDNVSLVGYNNITSIEGQLDTYGWNYTTGTTNWNLSIDTTKYSDGPHYLTVRGKYGTNFSYDYRSFKIDNTLPNTFTPVATPDTWTTTQPVITFSTSDSASGVDYYSLKIDSGSFTNQSSPYTLPSLADGIHTVTVRAFDKVGNFRESTVDVYIDIGVPNSFIVNANPSSWTTNTQPVITFSTTDATSGIDHYSLKVDAGVFSTQTSPYTMNSQTDGTHVVTVRAYDRANNYRESNVNAYIDTTNPRSFTPTANPSGWSPVTQPVIYFSTTDDTSGIDYYAIKIDTGSFSVHTSPYTLPVQNDGVHDITVRAYDKAGNYNDELVKVYIDTTLPNPFTPNANPSGWTNNTKPIISFSTTDSTSGMDYYKIKVDDGIFENQTSPYTLPPQTDGIHTITIRAYNKAGKYIDGVVKVYIDTQQPNLFFPMAIPNNWTNIQPVISFNTTDSTSGIESYQVRIDIGDFENQTSPYTLPYSEEGQHSITIRAFDKAGNYIDGKVNVYIDLTPPEPFDIKATPDTWTNKMPEISFSAEDNLSGIDFYEVQIGTGDFILQKSPYTLPTLTDGMNIITVRAFDGAGNQRDSNVMVYIDTTRPDEFLPIATPSSWTNAPIIISFATSDDISEIDHYKVRIDNSEFIIQTSPYALPNLLDGVHNITVQAVDLAGNNIEGTVQVFIDTTEPNLILNDSINGIWYNQSTLMLTWKYSDMGSGIQSVIVQQNDNPPIDVGLNTSHKFSELLNGPQRLRVTVFDNALNNLTRELNFSVDHSAPIISITSPSPTEVLFIVDMEIAWTGSDNENGSGLDHYEIKLDTDDYINLNKKTKHIFKTLAEGKHTVIISCMDVAGNWNFQSVTFFIDLTGPEIELQKSVDNTTVSGSMVFINWTGKDEISEIAYYEIKLDDGEFLNIGTKTFHSYYNLSKGAHTITIRAVDVGSNAGNTTLDFEVDVDKGNIPDKKDDDDEGLNNWSLIWMFILILIVIIIIIGILFFNIRKKRKEEYKTRSYYTYTEDEDEYWSSDEDMYRPQSKRVYDSTAPVKGKPKPKPKGKQTPAADMEYEYEEDYMPVYPGEVEEEYYEGGDSEVIDGDFVIVEPEETGEDDELQAIEELEE